MKYWFFPRRRREWRLLLLWTLFIVYWEVATSCTEPMAPAYIQVSQACRQVLLAETPLDATRTHTDTDDDTVTGSQRVYLLIYSICHRHNAHQVSHRVAVNVMRRIDYTQQQQQQRGVFTVWWESFSSIAVGRNYNTITIVVEWHSVQSCGD